MAGTVKSVIVPATPAAPASPPSAPTPVPETLAYCQVNFTYASGLAGPADGYNVGQSQMIKIEIVLPLSTADGGVTGSTSGISSTAGSVSATAVCDVGTLA